MQEGDVQAARAFNEALRQQHASTVLTFEADGDGANVGTGPSAGTAGGDPTGGTTPLGAELAQAEAELEAATARNDAAGVALADRKVGLIYDRARLAAAERERANEQPGSADFGSGTRRAVAVPDDMNTLIRAAARGVAYKESP